MRGKQIIFIAAVLLSAVCGALAQNISPKNSTQSSAKSPEQVIKEIYAIHAADLKANGEDRIVNGKTRRNLDKYFDKNLADLIWKDLTTHKDEVGVIDFDLFYATQDPQITNLRIGQAQITGDKATVPVTFNNSGTKDSVGFLLKKTGGGWKITDITYRDGETLLKYFKDDATQNK